MQRLMKKIVEDLGLEFMDKNGNPVTGEFFSRLESTMGTKLPPEYIEFTKSTMGVCQPTGKRLVFDCMPGHKSYVSVFYGDQNGGAYDIFENLDTYEDRIPSFLLPIGEDPGSNLICLGIKNYCIGKIYFWSHDEEGDSDDAAPGEEYTANVYLIANDLVSFLEKMASDDGNL